MRRGRRKALRETNIDAVRAVGSCKCFVAGTKVKTPSGYRNIEDIRPGDRVLSYNETTKRLEVQTVAQTFIRKTDRIYTLVYDTGTKLQTTATHPFYIEGKGWVKAADLHIGDDSLLAGEVSPLDIYGGARLQNVSYRQSKQGVIVGITVEERAETVYNFEVNETHTYLVGESDVVVHNAEKYTATDYARGMHDSVLGSGFRYVLMKNGLVLDVSHSTDSAREATRTIDQLDACRRSGAKTCQIEMSSNMHGGAISSTTRVSVDMNELGLDGDTGIDSPEFGNAVRGLMMTHNYLHEQRESAAIISRGTVFREEDLTSAAVGTEIALQQRRNNLTLAQAETMVLKSMGGADLKLVSREFEIAHRSYNFVAPTFAMQDGFTMNRQAMYEASQSHSTAVSGMTVTESQVRLFDFDVPHWLETDMNPQAALNRYRYNQKTQKAEVTK
jgi:hypothetical protein